MKKFAFVADFDGTLTEKDFYNILIDKYIGEEGHRLYEEWKKREKVGVNFLNKIFAWVTLSEADLEAEILKIPFDINGQRLIEEVRAQGGDFYIVSAGTSYYIKIFLSHIGLGDVNVISMPATYVDGHLKVQPDKSNPYYSEDFGLDKRKVVEGLKKENGYDFVYFAGDSEPDLTAAISADLAFTMGELSELMEKAGKPHIVVDNCGEILNYLVERSGREK